VTLEVSVPTIVLAPFLKVNENNVLQSFTCEIGIVGLGTGFTFVVSDNFILNYYSLHAYAIGNSMFILLVIDLNMPNQMA